MKNTASKFYFLHALSPLHIGVGQGAGVIDLPIAREKATHLPFVPGTAIKGVLREELRPEKDGDKDGDKADWEALFGPAKVNDDGAAFMGALLINDAHLLCLPVRSLAGTFAWATCPFILKRYAREAREARALKRYAREARALQLETPPEVPTVTAEQAITASTQDNKPSLLERDGEVILEDLNLTAGGDSCGSSWAKHLAQTLFVDDEDWQKEFIQRFVILPDGVFDFLAETATEIRARVKINHATRVVERGALWNEENLPSESLLYGVVYAEQSRKPKHQKTADEMLQSLSLLPQMRLQIGGHATTGRGLVRWVMGK